MGRPWTISVWGTSAILATLLLCWAQAARHQQSAGSTSSPQHMATNTEIYVTGCDRSANITCCAEEALRLRQRVAQLTKDLGALACKYEGIGPTGGFCHDPQQVGVGVGANDYLDHKVAGMLSLLFKGSSVLDMGCGLGHYGRVFEQHGIDWTGYDGAENIEAVTSGFVKWLDLSVPHWLGRRYDWVLSLEVGEHLPAKFEDIYLGNLMRHARCGIMTSWAVEGQGGHFHVNNHNNEYIVTKLAGHGFVMHEAQSAAIRQAAKNGTTHWFGNTLMVFYRKANMDRQACAAAIQTVF